jgi:hypothetical protein
VEAIMREANAFLTFRCVRAETAHAYDLLRNTSNPPDSRQKSKTQFPAISVNIRVAFGLVLAFTENERSTGASHAI